MLLWEGVIVYAHNHAISARNVGRGHHLLVLDLSVTRNAAACQSAAGQDLLVFGSCCLM